MGLHPAQQDRAGIAGYRIGFGDGLIIGHERPDLPVDEIGYDADAVRNILLRQYAHDHYKSSFTLTAQHAPVQVQLTGENGAEFEEQFLEYVKIKFLSGYDDGFQDGVIAAAEGVAVGTPVERWRRPAAVDLAKQLAINYFSSIGVGAVYVPAGSRMRIRKSEAESVRIVIRPYRRKKFNNGIDTLSYQIFVWIPESLAPKKSKEIRKLEDAKDMAKNRKQYEELEKKLEPLWLAYYKQLKEHSKNLAYKLSKWLSSGGLKVISSEGEEDGVFISFYT